MKLIIDIREEVYKRSLPYKNVPVISNLANDNSELTHAVANGIPLPKGYGRLIDADETIKGAWQNFYDYEDEQEKKDPDYIPFHRMFNQDGFEVCLKTIVEAPTIIGETE